MSREDIKRILAKKVGITLTEKTKEAPQAEGHPQDCAQKTEAAPADAEGVKPDGEK